MLREKVRKADAEVVECLKKVTVRHSVILDLKYVFMECNVFKTLNPVKQATGVCQIRVCRLPSKHSLQVSLGKYTLHCMRVTLLPCS